MSPVVLEVCGHGLGFTEGLNPQHLCIYLLNCVTAVKHTMLVCHMKSFGEGFSCNLTQ